ncbi:MAG TPA: ATP-binding cassette domain-containing protein [Trueperaceae bacterium]|nr:ATP-binding cassette domain-containing protein [Trueperaceae bacterium]
MTKTFSAGGGGGSASGSRGAGLSLGRRSTASHSPKAVIAVDDLSFEVAAGEVYGLLGPNGAGKTTTLRILATLLEADSGTATVAGHDVKTEPEAVRASIGVVNGGMGLYDRLTGREILHYFGALYGMTPTAVEARIEVLDQLLQLGDTLPRRAGGFSTGMKQKVVIARAVIHDPPVIFFDEATSGLDIVARRNVIDFVQAYPTEQRCVVYSTHVMSEVEELCQRACIIYQGAKMAEGTIAEIVAAGEGRNLEDAFFRMVSRRSMAVDTVPA